jgi:hypothetical protein
VEHLLATDPAASDELVAYRTIVDALPLTAPIQTATAPSGRQSAGQHSARAVSGRKPARVLHAGRRDAGHAAGCAGHCSAEGIRCAASIYNDLLASQSVQRIAVVPGLDPAIEGELVYETGTDRAVLRVSNLPALADEQAFQLWLVDESGARSGGIYRLTDPTNYVRLPLDQPRGSLYPLWHVAGTGNRQPAGRWAVRPTACLACPSPPPEAVSISGQPSK